MSQHQHDAQPRPASPLQALLNSGGLATSRIEALSDGVFAIAMTLLVLEIHLPASDQPLISWLSEQRTALFAYALSFGLLGVYWISHHVQFQYIKRANRILLWINIAQLMFISFIPFSAHLLSDIWNRIEQEREPVIIFYGMHLIIIAVLIFWHWWYATGNAQLIGGTIDAHLRNSGARRILVSPLMCLLAMALSFINPILSFVCYSLIPIVYILPTTNIDLHLTNKGAQHDKPVHKSGPLKEVGDSRSAP